MKRHLNGNVSQPKALQQLGLKVHKLTFLPPTVQHPVREHSWKTFYAVKPVEWDDPHFDPWVFSSYSKLLEWADAFTNVRTSHNRRRTSSRRRTRHPDRPRERQAREPRRVLEPWRARVWAVLRLGHV